MSVQFAILSVYGSLHAYFIPLGDSLVCCYAIIKRFLSTSDED